MAVNVTVAPLIVQPVEVPSRLNVTGLADPPPAAATV